MESGQRGACGGCGESVDDGDRFCSSCGGPVAGAPRPSAVVDDVGSTFDVADPSTSRGFSPQTISNWRPPSPIDSPYPLPGDYSPPAAYPPRGAYPAPSSGTNGLAIASLVLGLVWLWGLGSLLALIFGIMGKNQIDASGGRQGGRGLAVAGTVLGIIGLAGLVVFIILVAAASSSSPTY
jgi:hypothetical protein